jgi:acyl-CoA synthetase (AMP-forming)/AMP-acid ligase II
VWTNKYVSKIYYSIVFLAVIGAGGVFSGTNPAYTQTELSHHIRTAKVNFLISEPEILGNLKAAAKDCNIPASNIWIFDTRNQSLPSGFCSWTELTKHGEEDWVRFDDPNICHDTTAARLFSSGTTGLPKAAMISHKNLIAQHKLVFETKPLPHEVSLNLLSRWNLRLKPLWKLKELILISFC